MSDERKEDGIELANIKVDDEVQKKFGEELVAQIADDAKHRTKEDIQYGVELTDIVERGVKEMVEETKSPEEPKVEEGSRESSDGEER